MRQARQTTWKRRALGAVIGLAVAAIGLALLSVFQPNWAPAQPVAFSHRVHVTDKKLQCFFCHPSPMRASNAGMPSVNKCLLCHYVIAPNFFPIRPIHQYYAKQEPIPWVRVYRVPEHVKFSHQAHLNKRIDCGECHGNVAKMDRIEEVHRFNMDFCVSCHWREKASDSCFRCHH